MATLNPTIRGLLETTVTKARDIAEAAASDALDRLSVTKASPHDTLTADEKELRRVLREEARRLGDVANGGDYARLPRLAAECAYEQWHRILFARFLAENRLLMHPDEQIPVSLADCRELAREEHASAGGESDGWMLAARYAQKMLPGIFRNDDPILQVRFAPEHRQALQKLAADLPVEVFTSDDGLGWVYQFWQTKRKAEVNASGAKIGGDDICAVTQLFTEPYMVQFLLHNSLGAWWLNRHPAEPLPLPMEYLRTNEDGAPAAGGFEGWPNKAAEITIMDPCCGSGHFVVAAFEIMVAFRKAEEGLSDAEAGDAVIRDNLHALELDPRCTQIAAFNLALAAWRHGGYRPLPLPKIACSGLRVGGTPREWQRLALRTPGLEGVLNQLFTWFQQAPDLGSLIDPEKADGGIYKAPDWSDVLGKLTAAIERFQGEDDPAAAIFGEAAVGAVRAAELLFSKFTLICTNVPYLAIRKQETRLRDYLAKSYSNGRFDLAAAFIDRCISFTGNGNTFVVVSPQTWASLGSYEEFRRELLTKSSIQSYVRLGPGAFETITGEVVKVTLLISTLWRPSFDHRFIACDLSSQNSAREKALALRRARFDELLQYRQTENPNAVLSLVDDDRVELLGSRASGIAGIMSGDAPHFQRYFFELPNCGVLWSRQMTTVDATVSYGGCKFVLYYDREEGHLRESAIIRRQQLHDSDRRGRQAWGKKGVVVSSMGALPVSLYTGDLFDNNTAVVLPNSESDLPAIWCFCMSPEFNAAVRRIDQTLKVTNATLVKVPFDLDDWQSVAAERYPNGLPEPHSDDPTQWLFKGDVASSERPLHVAMARLLGYRWPDQESDALDDLADADGIVCLPAVAGEEPAARRLEALIARAYGDAYSPQVTGALLAADTHPAPDVATWLRDGFFASHCRLFHNRPFLWHIWDGRKDGFSAIVNYHKLDRRNLEKLIYTYLGAWIRDARIADERGEAGANARLVAALQLQKKLEAIVEGEPPYDIFVRWKPLQELPIGWEPDLNDGVRMNIRPFVEAGVLRSKFTINWNKDRGANPLGSPYGTERHNDKHFTRAEKEAARARHRAAEEAKAAAQAARASRADAGTDGGPPPDVRAGETNLLGEALDKNLFGEVDVGGGRKRRGR